MHAEIFIVALFLTASLGSSGLRNNYFVLLRFWEQFAKCAAKQKKHKNCIILFLKNQTHIKSPLRHRTLFEGLCMKQKRKINSYIFYHNVQMAQFMGLCRICHSFKQNYNITVRVCLKIDFQFFHSFIDICRLQSHLFCQK